MLGQNQQLLTTGIIVLIIIIGVMGMIFFNYINKVMNKIEDIPDLKGVVTKVERLVGRVEQIHREQGLCRQKQDLEVSTLRGAIEGVQSDVRQLQRRTT